MMPGTIGKFRLERVLGRGGGGEVWKAWDAELARWVALKFLKGEDPEELARFRREAAVAGGLSHPNIASIFEVGERDGRHFIAMQFVDGTTLKALERTNRREAARVVLGAAGAVGYAHAQGVIHRDLKPDNIMLSGGRVLVMDFGLARPIAGGSEITTSGFVVGTPEFMPPEQARGDRADARADVYSLGATLYWLLTRRPPHRAGSVFETLKRVVEDEPVAPRALDPAIESDLEAVALRCLEKEPGRRYATAEALAADLQRYLAGEPVEAKPVGSIVRLGRSIARKRAIVAITVGAAVVTAVAVIWARSGLERTGGRLSATHQALVEQMRRSTDSLLVSALDQRRAGRTDQMKAIAVLIEEECARVLKELPSLAEAHYRLGRIRRAMMQDDRARESVTKALEIDPSYVAARYERVVLDARRLREKGHLLLDRWRASEAARNVTAEGVLELGELRPEPSWSVLIEADSEAGPLRRGLEEDLSRLEGLAAVERTCAGGLKSWAAGRDGEAIPALESASALEEAVEARASIAEERKRLDEAEAWWTRGLEQDAGYLPFWEGRGRARTEKARALRRQAKPNDAERDGAIADFTRMIELDPSNPRGWHRRGVARLDLAFGAKASGRDAFFEAAERDVTEALARDAGLAEAYWARGRVRLNWGFAMFDTGADGTVPLEGAIADYGEAAKRVKGVVIQALIDRVMARTVLAHAKGRDGFDSARLFEEAIRDAHDAVKANLRNADAWMARSYARLMLARHLSDRDADPAAVAAEALQDAESAVALDSRCERAWRSIGLLRQLEASRLKGEPAAKAWAESERAFCRALELVKSAGELWKDRAHTRLCWALVEQDLGGDPETRCLAALADAARSVELAPAMPGGWESIGRIEAALGLRAYRRRGAPLPHYERAETAFTQALQLEPARLSALLERADARLRSSGMMGRIEDRQVWLRGAVADARAASNVAPRKAVAWSKLGVALGSLALELARAGIDVGAEFEEAGKAHERATGLSSAVVLLSSRADTFLSRAAWELMRRVDARPSMRKALEDGREIVRRAPESAEGHRLVAQSLYLLALIAKEQSPAEADAGFREALAAAARSAERDASKRSQVGMIRADYARFRFDRGEESGAERRRAIEELRAAMPDPAIRLPLAQALVEEGSVMQDTGRDPSAVYGEAVRACDDVLKEGNSDDAYRHRGAARRNLAHWNASRGRFAREDFEAAIRDLDAAAKVKPGDPSTLKTRAETKVLMAQNALTKPGWPGAALDSAIADFSEILRLRPGDLEALASRGRADGKLGAHRQATSGDGT